jgi:hypothetical protein
MTYVIAEPCVKVLRRLGEMITGSGAPLGSWS